MVVDYKAMATSVAQGIGRVVKCLNIWYEGELQTRHQIVVLPQLDSSEEGRTP
jgi:hypothetical protein